MPFNVSFSVEFLLQTRQVPINEQASAYDPRVTVQVYPAWYKQVAIEWSIPASMGNCLFNVYFAPTENGPFVKLNAAPLDQTYLADVTTQEYSKRDKGWYIVEAILPISGLLVRSNPTTWTTFQRKWVGLRSQEIQRREYWLLSKFTGVESQLFRRKSYGLRCPRCWSDRNEQILDDHCPVCIGTSFDGGYFEPYPLFLQYESTPDERQRVYYGISEPNQIGAWTISLPEINVYDVIVRKGDWAVYRVERILTTELQANTVRQILTLTELSKGDVEHKLVSAQLILPPGN